MSSCTLDGTTRASTRVDATDDDATSSKPPKSKLFAFLIGIDKYQDSARNLLGAVNDAQRIKDFLLGQQPPVSEDRIVFLKNGRATADTIIKCLRYLGSSTYGPLRGTHVMDEVDLEFQGKALPSHNDPILFYYAGHGSTLPKPEGWASDNPRIQCLSPHDARIDANNSVINVVPDRTFGALLERLADARGRNITVLLDCCYSGSGTRNDATPRGMEFKASDGSELTVKASYHHDIWAGSQRGAAHLAKFANAGLTSHVVLAACGPDESAYEDREKHEGRFTSAFLSVLEKAGPDTLTYSELIKRLDYLPSQTPRCEGRDKDVRILFDAGLKQRDRDCYAIEHHDQVIGALYKVRAGQIHGIGKDDVFAIYQDRNTFRFGGDPLGSLVVKSVTPDMSHVALVDGTSLDVTDMSKAVAALSRVKSPDAFRVSVDISDNYPKLRERVEAALMQVVSESAASSNSTSSTDSSAPRVAETSVKASISIVPGRTDNTVYFNFQNGIIRETLGLKRLSGPVKAEQAMLVSALRSAAHFFRHLGSSPSMSPMPGTPSSTSKFFMRDYVDVRICELEGNLGLSNEGVLVNQLHPTGDFVDAKLSGLFEPKLSLVGDRNPTQTLYGVDILNRSGINMYAWLFYFDCSTLQIIEYYSPPAVAGNRDPPLPAHMKTALPMNYGDSGGIPLAFEVPDKLAFDGGFLRIFLSTRYIELSKVAQPAVVRPGSEMGTVLQNHLKLLPDLWDAITIPIKLGESPRVPLVVPARLGWPG